MSEVTIFHNPACGTSRNTLALLRHAGIEPAVVEYLKMPPSRDKLKELLAAMAIPVRSLLRKKARRTTSSDWTTPSGRTSSCWTSSASTRS
ncbi:MAG: arsenate reductase [Ramlibacter sp.]|nr:arsenate reductase [Ramlibacter sp.]